MINIFRLVSEWPDVVTFTKALSENIVQSASHELPVCIIRPGFGNVHKHIRTRLINHTITVEFHYSRSIKPNFQILCVEVKIKYQIILVIIITIKILYDNIIITNIYIKYNKYKIS